MENFIYILQVKTQDSDLLLPSFNLKTIREELMKRLLEFKDDESVDRMDVVKNSKDEITSFAAYDEDDQFICMVDYSKVLILK